MNLASINSTEVGGETAPKEPLKVTTAASEEVEEMLITARVEGECRKMTVGGVTVWGTTSEPSTASLRLRSVLMFLTTVGIHICFPQRSSGSFTLIIQIHLQIWVEATSEIFLKFPQDFFTITATRNQEQHLIDILSILIFKLIFWVINEFIFLNLKVWR